MALPGRTRDRRNYGSGEAIAACCRGGGDRGFGWTRRGRRRFCCEAQARRRDRRWIVPYRRRTMAGSEWRLRHGTDRARGPRRLPGPAAMPVLRPTASARASARRRPGPGPRRPFARLRYSRAGSAVQPRPRRPEKVRAPQRQPGLKIPPVRPESTARIGPEVAIKSIQFIVCPPSSRKCPSFEPTRSVRQAAAARPGRAPWNPPCPPAAPRPTLRRTSPLCA